MKTALTSLKRIALIGVLSVTVVSISSCTKDVRTDGYDNVTTPKLLELSQEQLDVISYLPRNVIIAHRGTEFWAPEESEAAMRWARNMGADYLEIDVQRTSDGVILALHDENLTRTTNVSLVYPNRQNDYVYNFTYEELLELEIGSWFNAAYPQRARADFEYEEILTVEDVVMIAEGYRIKRDPDTRRRIYTKTANPEGSRYPYTYHFEYEKDDADNGHRPGVYIETKAPYMFGNIENELAELLTRLGWYNDDINQLKQIQTYDNRVALANTPARFIMQTFSTNSIINFKSAFNRLIPIVYLMYEVTGSVTQYAEMINFAVANGVTIMAPMIDYVSGYPSSINTWQGDMIRRTGMHIHPWSFNTQEQYIKYTGPWTNTQGREPSSANYLDASFTNLTDLALNFYNEYLQPLADDGTNYFLSNSHLTHYSLPDNPHKNKPKLDPRQVLTDLGYE